MPFRDISQFHSTLRLVVKGQLIQSVNSHHGLIPRNHPDLMNDNRYTEEGNSRKNNAAAASSGGREYYRQVVKKEILRQLSTSAAGVSIESISRSVGIPVRTLQRRLSTNGVTFRVLLDECRQERAIELLLDTRYPVAEVGKLLGYSDPAHFARAFRRWSQHSPSEYLKSKLPTRG